MAFAPADELMLQVANNLVVPFIQEFLLDFYAKKKVGCTIHIF